MPIKKIFFLLFLSIVIIACDDDDDETTTSPTSISWIESANNLPEGIGAMGSAEVPGGFMIFGGKSESTTLADTYFFSESDQSISQGPNLNIPRSHPLCIPMQNENVLIIGGVDINGDVVSTCEIYDPSANTITITDAMDSPRARHKGILLEDGRVLVTGGTSILNLNDFMATIGATTASIELYDPVSSTWSNGPDMSDARVTHFVSSLSDGTVLISGGLSVSASGLPMILNSCETFDPTTNAFSDAPNMNVGRSEHTCTTLQDGRILCTGGGTINGMNVDALSDVELYDSFTNSWTTIPNMSTSRAGHIGFVLEDGSVVTPSGDSGSLTATTPTVKTELFDPATNEWSEIEDLPIALSGYAGYITSDYKIVIIGGALSDGELSSKIIMSE